MSRGFVNLMKGFGSGLMVGMVAGIIGSCYVRSNKRGLKRNVGKALRNVGNLVDNVTGMF